MADVTPTPDYRHVMYSTQAQRETDLSWKPTREDLQRRAEHYAPILDRFIPSDRSSTVLEIGCGWGAFLAALQNRGYTHLEAVEITPECCSLVEDYLGIVPVCEEAVGYLSRVRGPYDVIAAFDVIEHFRKDEILSLVGRVRDLLRPGGVFVMRVPNCGSLGGMNAFHSGFTHETGFTPLSAHELFTALGFSRITCMPEPVFARNPIRTVLKRALVRTMGKVVYYSTAGAIPAEYALSKNIIAGGWKP